MRVVLGLLLLVCCGGLVSAVPDIINADSSNTFHATNGVYDQGWFFTGSTNANPTLNMTIGTTYYISVEFDTTTTHHPFGLNAVSGTGTGSLLVVENGLVVNGTCGGTASTGYTATAAQKCVLAFTPNATTPQLYYHCAVHSAMWGTIQLNATASTPTTPTPTTPTPTTPTPTTPVPTNTVNPDANNTFHVTGGTPGAGWTFAGGTAPNPTLNVAYGKTYTISIEFDTVTSHHPFGLNTVQSSTTVVDGFGLGANTTCTGSATAGFSTSTTCTLSFTPPANTPQPLFYHCAVHGGMVGQVVVSGLPTSTPTPTATPGNTTTLPTKAPGGSGFALVPGFAALAVVVAGLFGQ